MFTHIVRPMRMPAPMRMRVRKFIIKCARRYIVRLPLETRAMSDLGPEGGVTPTPTPVEKWALPFLLLYSSFQKHHYNLTDLFAA